MRHVLLAIAALLMAPVSPLAQTSESLPKQDLDQAANDPTASLMSFQIQDFYTPNLHDIAGVVNVVQFRAAIPFEALGLNHIARVTVPAVTNSPTADPGVGDTTLFDLVTFDRLWGRFGVGAVALFPTGGSQHGAEKWALGPAAGFVAQQDKLLVGLFNQNLFTVAGDGSRRDVNLSTVQPILNYKLGDGWSAGVSEMTFVYDWEQGEMVSLPLGAKISKLVKVSGVPVQLQLSYEHNFYDGKGSPEDTFGLTVKLLLPR